MREHLQTGKNNRQFLRRGQRKKKNLKPDGLWEVYAKNDAIFGVKPGDANIKGNPEEYLIEPVDDDDGLDVMTATYCPQCGLATFSKFNVYDQPYPGYFPDRNMFPNARLDNKNLQFCGVGDEYETNKTLTDRAKFHFAVHVGLRESYVKHLAKFTTRQFVMLGHTQCETLPNGGCLQAFTRKQAVDGLEYQKKKSSRQSSFNLVEKEHRELEERVARAENTRAKGETRSLFPCGCASSVMAGEESARATRLQTGAVP